MKQSPLKITFRNNGIYNAEETESYHYEESKENDDRVIINIQDIVQNNIQKEDENYELVEEKETTV